MKTQILKIAAVLILVILTNCKKTEETIAPSLSVNPTTKDIESTTGNFNMVVTSTVAWSASCDKNWIILDPMSGTGNATVKADFQENSSATSRTASIVFKGVGVEDRVVSVTQLGIQPILTVSPANLSVAADAGNAVINITSNLSWTVTSNQTWCTLAQSSGIGNAALTINYQPNTVQSQRSAIITFAANGVTNQTVQVTQAAFVPVLSVTPSNQTVNSPSGSAVFNVTSNISWTAACAESWCTLANPGGTNNGTLTVIYDENTTSGPRTATITVSGEGVSNQSVTLTQTNLIPTLSVTPSNRDVTSATGSTTFEITSNTSWTAESNQTWCVIQNTTGSGNATLTVNFEENTSNDQRVAAITLSANGVASQTATVTQQGAIPTDGLVAWYPFNGNTNDESGTGNNGVNYGATLTTDRKGNSNNAYNFNGIDAYIKASSNNLPTGARTISLWFYANAINTPVPVPLAYGGGAWEESWLQSINPYDWATYCMATHGSYYPFCYYTLNLPVNQWYQWVITNDITGRKMYVNGVLVSTDPTFVPTTNVTNKDLAIGVCVSPSGYAPYTDGSVGWFDGKIDDIRIYNRALTEQEIQQLYNE